jgi:hypothetical protein
VNPAERTPPAHIPYKQRRTVRADIFFIDHSFG